MGPQIERYHSVNDDDDDGNKTIPYMEDEN